MNKKPIIIRGGGNLALGGTYVLNRCGCQINICELNQPTKIRRTVSFPEGIRQGIVSVEGISRKRLTDSEITRTIKEGHIPVHIDSEAPPYWTHSSHKHY